MANNRIFSLFKAFLGKSSSSEEKKIHPAITHFRQLQMSAPSTHLKKFLSSFNESRSIDPKTFEEGVKKFIQLANSNPLYNSNHPSSRETLYGNIYSGLHYNNDLVKLWNNNTHNEPIQASHVTTLSPSDWDSISQDGFIVLIYRGQQPAQALDQLVKGPTVIDCGMFTQLSLWFGIRYMLGNERFNQYFGRAPFFITQYVYNRIKDSNKPYLGNPLYSFLSAKEQLVTPSVTVKHLTNTSLYRLKHPGGNGGGQNCVLIDNQYYIFAPLLENTQGLTESAVLNLLRQGFNAERTQYDIDRLSLYAANPKKIHSKLLQTYVELIVTADFLKDKQLTEEEFRNVEQNPSLELTFDLHKFSNWLQIMENNLKQDQIEYKPQAIDHSRIPVDLLNVIPFENRTSMDFSQFEQKTPQQKELIAISQQFCQRVMLNESKLVILTGKAGVGKTASAVCAAKELAANGKKIVWISEVMVHGWANQATSMEELDQCNLEIDKLLATNPDAIFLDDDNLTGFSGNLLLEKIYSWYVKHPGKGLFITSNEPICFKKCYGHKLDGKYHYPPYSDYNSPQYIQWQYKIDLAGSSLRSKHDGQSIGAIVSDASWKMNQSKLEQVELIPGFDNKNELVPIRQSLRETGSKGSAYDKLSPLQQQWIRITEVTHCYNTQGLVEESHFTANPSNFEKTTCKTIALEIREYIFPVKTINYHSMKQIMSVLNYAHDQGGRRIILINQTSFSNEELLAEIKKELPSSERERTWSRLMLLLCETEETIFNYDQFNGRIENNVTPERTFSTEDNKDRDQLFLFRKTFMRNYDDAKRQHEHNKKFGLVLKK